MKITSDVRAVLERGIEIEGATLKIPAQLDRVLYMKVMKVLTALDIVWSKSMKVHVFGGDGEGRIERALIAGEATTDRDVGFFATPPALADRIARFVVPEAVPEAFTVLEPSAGEGAIVSALVKRGASVHAIEWDLRRRQTLRDWFIPDPVGVSPFDDFMKYQSNPTARGSGTILAFEAIAANPPFCKVGLGDHVDHLALMLELLTPGGRLACVMPASLLFREDRRYVSLRMKIAANKGRIEALPAQSFKASGTNVNTCVVLVGKADF